MMLRVHSLARFHDHDLIAVAGRRRAHLTRDRVALALEEVEHPSIMTVPGSSFREGRRGGLSFLETGEQEISKEACLFCEQESRR